MSTRTTYYNLTKPDADEHVLRTVINQNYDAIDLQMHANAEAAKDAAESLAAAYDETASYSAGDFCIYQNKLLKANASTTGTFNPADWDETTIEAEFEPKGTWTLYETYTVDTGAATIQRPLPAKVKGIFVHCTLAAGAANASFGVVIQFSNNMRRSISDQDNVIQTSTIYVIGQYIRDGANFWSGFLSERSTVGTGNQPIRERMDNFYLTDLFPTLVEFRTQTSGQVIPTGSVFKIYVKQ